jgi:hypothetical protein
MSVVAVRSLWKRQLSAHARPAAAIAAGGFVPALYALSLTRLDPDWKGVLAQYGNAGVYTPSPPHLVILLGLPLLLALPQLRPAAWNHHDVANVFVRVWLIVGFGLLYIPTDYQIKMLTGYQIPLGILAAQTVTQMRSANASGWYRPLPARAGLIILLVFAVALTNVYLTAWRVVDLRRTDYPYFLTSGDVAALQSLDDVAPEKSIVLSSPLLGQFVPVYSDARPYVAHWAQTLRYHERAAQAKWFFSHATSDTDRSGFIRDQNIDFVIAGPAEALISDSQLPIKLELDAVVGNSTVLYQARPSSGIVP